VSNHAKLEFNKYLLFMQTQHNNQYVTLIGI